MLRIATPMFLAQGGTDSIPVQFTVDQIDSTDGGTIQIGCTSELPVAGAVEVSAAGGSTLQNFLNGTYRFSLKTTKKVADIIQW